MWSMKKGELKKKELKPNLKMNVWNARLGRRAFRKVGQMSCGEMVDLLIPSNMHICNEVPSRSCRLNKTIEEGGNTETFGLSDPPNPYGLPDPRDPPQPQHPPNRTKSSKRKRLIKPSRFVSVFVDYLVEFDNNNKHCQRHYGPRRWLLWPVILIW